MVKVQYKMASATSNGVVIEGRLAAVSDPDATDVDAKAFAAANTAGTSTVPGTAGHMNEISLTLTNADSVAAGDFVVAVPGPGCRRRGGHRHRGHGGDRRSAWSTPLPTTAGV